MAISIASTKGSEAPNWADFYINNRDDNGPFQAMFGQTFQSSAERTVQHLGDSNALTAETILGSSNGNTSKGGNSYYNNIPVFLL